MDVKMKKKKVAVLLSIYNGRKFLDELLLSLEAQQMVDVYLFIRNDNYPDSCADIIEKHRKNFAFLKFVDGKTNLGFAESFYLLAKTCGNFDYYAFCDQDDIWDSKKLITSINYIEKADKNKPILYCGNFVTFDNDKILCVNRYKKINKYQNYLQNISPGCTMVFNDSLMKYFREFRPNEIKYHDQRLLFLCLAVSGEVKYSDESWTWYRQHGSNLIGHKKGFFTKFKNLFSIFKIDYSYIFKEIYYVLNDVDLIEHVNEDSKVFFEKVTSCKSNLKSKISLILSDEVKSFSFKFYIKFILILFFGNL